MSETRTRPEPAQPGQASGPEASGALPPETQRALMALIIGGVAAVLDTTIVSIALNTLVRALHSTVGQIQWVSTGYLLALGVVIPVVGWGQARFGGRRLWMAALTLFVAGSALCAVAWNAESLIGFRVLQGVGAGMIFPLMQTLAMQAARSAQGGTSFASGRVVATVSLPLAIGPVLGPVLGGVILNWLDWRWLFLVNVPVCVIGLYLAWRWLPADTPPAGAQPRLDLPGLLLIAPAWPASCSACRTSARAAALAALMSRRRWPPGWCCWPRSRSGLSAGPAPAGPGPPWWTCGCCGSARSARPRPCCS